MEFVFLGVFLLALAAGLVFPIILAKEFFFRPREMRGMANEFNLSYSISDKTKRGARNLIRGRIGSHQIRVYDITEIKWIPLTRGGNLGNQAIRRTILEIDGHKEVLTGFVSGYYSVSKLKERLSHLSNQ